MCLGSQIRVRSCLEVVTTGKLAAVGYCCPTDGCAGTAQLKSLTTRPQADFTWGTVERGSAASILLPHVSSNEITRERIKSALFYFSVISVPCEFMGM